MYWLEEGVRQDRSGEGTLDPYVAGLFACGDGE